MNNFPLRRKLILLSLGLQIEENYLSAEEFARGLNQKDIDNTVLKNELRVLEALHFDLIVHSPYRPLEGFRLEIEDYTNQLQAGKEKAISKTEVGSLVQECSQRARKVLDALVLSDAILISHPGKIALAALRIAAKEDSRIPIDKFLNFVATQVMFTC